MHEEGTRNEPEGTPHLQKFIISAEERSQVSKMSNTSNDVTSAAAGDHEQPPSDAAAAGESRNPQERDDGDEKIPQLPKPVCTPAEAANTLGTKELENLFIDMSFYARLGFLQAPSCLRCAYREAHAGTAWKDALASQGCGRLVMWRKDTALPIHPDNLQANAAIVSCQSAKALMRGESVGGVHWDKTTQKLVSD